MFLHKIEVKKFIKIIENILWTFWALFNAIEKKYFNFKYGKYIYI